MRKMLNQAQRNKNFDGICQKNKIKQRKNCLLNALIYFKPVYIYIIQLLKKKQRKKGELRAGGRGVIYFCLHQTDNGYLEVTEIKEPSN